MPQTLKTTRTGHHLPPIELKTFKESELYVVTHLKQYIKMTAPCVEMLVQTNHY